MEYRTIVRNARRIRRPPPILFVTMKYASFSVAASRARARVDTNYRDIMRLVRF